MSLRDRLTKTLLFLSITLYYLAGYFFINEWTSHRHRVFHLALPFEKNIPLLPALIFAYVMIYIFLAVPYLVIEDLDYFKKIVKSFFICVTLHFAIFLIFPVGYNLRPVVNPDQGWAYALVDFYYWLDLPYNSFPSMHISNAFLVAFFMRHHRPYWGWIMLPLAFLVAISVVLVKQHYIVDVVAGYLVGWSIFWRVFTPLKAKSHYVSPLDLRGLH